MKTLELFCGTKSFSKVADSMGYETRTLDNNPKFNPTYTMDILDFDVKMLDGFKPNIIWASPPCECFSIASIRHHWNYDKTNDIRTPKSDASVIAIRKVEKTIEIIKELNPQFVFIENPRAMLRKLNKGQYPPNTASAIAQKDLIPFENKFVTYCQYGEKIMKPTDIWTNNKEWLRVAKSCKNGMPCHESAPRGSKTGTQGIKNAELRGVVPSLLIEEILHHCQHKSLPTLDHVVDEKKTFKKDFAKEKETNNRKVMIMPYTS